MGTFDHSSELVHRIAFPAEKPVLRNHRRLAAFTKEGKERPAPSKPDDDLIFQSLIVSGDKLAPRNPWVTFGALLVEVLALVGAVVVPILHVEPLPKRERSTAVYLEAPVKATVSTAQLKSPKPAPTHAPAKAIVSAPVHMTQEAPPNSAETTLALTAGSISGSPDGAVTGILGGQQTVAVLAKAPEPAPAKRIRVASGVAEANLIHDVPPQYPAEAGRERIEGMVVLLAVIGTDGSVKEVRVESGPQLLAQAAIDAVKQWRYKPYLLNGVPVEIDSRITVNFTVSRG